MFDEDKSGRIDEDEFFFLLQYLAIEVRARAKNNRLLDAGARFYRVLGPVTGSCWCRVPRACWYHTYLVCFLPA